MDNEFDILFEAQKIAGAVSEGADPVPWDPKPIPWDDEHQLVQMLSTKYAIGTETLRFALDTWRARTDEATVEDFRYRTLDIDIKGILGWPYIRPRVTGDSILDREVPAEIDFLVLMHFPNFYSDGKYGTMEAPFVYTLLEVVEILAYDGQTATVRTDGGFVFPDVYVVWPLKNGGFDIGK